MRMLSIRKMQNMLLCLKQDGVHIVDNITVDDDDGIQYKTGTQRQEQWNNVSMSIKTI